MEQKEVGIAGDEDAPKACGGQQMQIVPRGSHSDVAREDNIVTDGDCRYGYRARNILINIQASHRLASP